jgi:hypothetical protein
MTKEGAEWFTRLRASAGQAASRVTRPARVPRPASRVLWTVGDMGNTFVDTHG